VFHRPAEARRKQVANQIRLKTGAIFHQRNYDIRVLNRSAEANSYFELAFAIDSRSIVVLFPLDAPETTSVPGPLLNLWTHQLQI